jgi:hypothetical protein
VNDAKPEPAEALKDAKEEARRRRERVFGDVLPDTTADEREGDPGRAESSGDEWLRRNVPPHHG